VEFENFINNEDTSTETLTAQAKDNAGSSASTSSPTISYTAATINSVTFEPNSKVVDASTILDVTFQVGAFDLTSGFNIILTFPTRFDNSQSYFASNPTCSNGTANIAASPT
jgi:hypothetical protein